MRAWMRQHIRNRGLWHPRRESVAAGLAGGLFLAMLPIPLQSFVAAGVGISRGWNLPAAISATWLSNPFTYAPMIIGAKWTISGAYGLFGADCAASHLSVQRAGEIMKEAGAFHFSLAWQMAGPAIVQIAAGMVLMGLLFATISYVMVHALWATFHRLVKN